MLDRFIENMRSLIAGVDMDLYSSSVDATFERICGALLKKQRGDKVWYDGTGDLSYEISDRKTLIFTGNMHVMEGQTKHWVEPFTAEVSLTSSYSHCDVTVICSGYKSSENLYHTFGYT